MVQIPKTVPPLPTGRVWTRELAPSAALGWLAEGWHDLVTKPGVSLFYGLLVFIVSAVIVWGLFALGLDYILLPALAGFMVVGPALAIGLYEKSRRIENGEPVTLAASLKFDAAAGGQVLFIGAILLGLMLLWMRAAVILYALFYGVRPFPGMGQVFQQLTQTPLGITLLVVGTVVGGLFAAFAFAISAFSVPMLLDKKVDAFTAMATSFVLVWHNLPLMLTWGLIVLVLFLVCLATGLVGLVVIFPLLGHATWHAYEAVR